MDLDTGYYMRMGFIVYQIIMALLDNEKASLKTF